MIDTLKDWLGSFWSILISPTPKTFLAEAKKGDGKFASAVWWLVFFALYLYILANVFIGPTSFVVLLTALVLLPLAVVLFASAMHFAYQRIAHRREYLYDKLLYLTVCILLPLESILVPVALALPGQAGRVLSYVLLLYQAALLAIALKALARIELWQALLSVLVSVIAAILVFGTALLLIYSTVSGQV